MALEFGMTEKEFWRDDPSLFNSYRTFFINKFKIQNEIDNNNAWLFGLYTHNALNVSLSNMWAKEGDEPAKYLEKPIDFYNFNKANKQEKELEEKLKANLKYYANKENFISK